LMDSKICLITGGSDGLGLATAHQLANKGLELILVGRNQQKLAKASQEIMAKTGNQKLTTFVTDLSSQREIRKLSEEIHQRFDKIDILINNAGGVFSSFLLTEEELEKTIATNHFSYFLLTNLLLDLLKKAGKARIINVASQNHWQGRIDFESFKMEKSYNLVKAYNQSKLANLLFTYELANRLKETHITVNAISPGRVSTNIGNTNQPWYVSLIWTLLTRLSSISTKRGAAIYIYLATSEEVTHISGKYFDRNQAIIPSSPLSYDKALAQQLWEQSEKLVNQTFPIAQGSN
jgi:NAD(P)-dependent dehydrogenase (short-subunit alcohol dehydrogenase family)